jgi:hypothetical protein
LPPANSPSIEAVPLEESEPEQTKEAKATATADESVPGGKRQQGDVPGLLDGAGQAALVLGADAGEPPGHDLAALGHKALQQPDIAVRDRVDLLGAELADLLAAEELSAAARSSGGPSAWSAGTATGSAAGAVT